MPKRNEQVQRLTDKEFDKAGVAPGGPVFLQKKPPSISNKTLLVIAGCIGILLLGYLVMLGSGRSTAVDIDPAKFEELSKRSDITIIDVRSGLDSDDEKIKGAENISFASKEFRQKVEQLDKNRTYLLYCESGFRSAEVVSVMQALGFKNIYNLKGGIESWKDAGKPVVR